MHSNPVRLRNHVVWFASALVLGILLSGCTRSTSLSLLEQPSSQASLTTPPSDALALADPNAPPSLDDEIQIGPGGAPPTDEQLYPVPAPGLDVPRTAAALETDLLTAKASADTLWRGKMGVDGVDIVNVQGTLCSGIRQSDGVTIAVPDTITLACSDGRMGQLRRSASGGPVKVIIEGTAETVELN